MVQNPDKEKWNEFDWELELRKDDARVCAYAADLPKYIDLPDEDGVIMTRIQKHSELAPAGGDWSRLGPVPYDRGDEDDEDEDDEEDPARSEANWKKTPCGPIFRGAAQLARDWSILFSVVRDPELAIPSMRILCLYGKMMARSGDIIDMDSEQEDPVRTRPLKIALCKRLLADINAIMGEMFKLHAHSPLLEQKCQDHEDALTQMRDILFDVLSALRADKAQ